MFRHFSPLIHRTVNPTGIKLRRLISLGRNSSNIQQGTTDCPIHSHSTHSYRTSFSAVVPSHYSSSNLSHLSYAAIASLHKIQTSQRSFSTSSVSSSLPQGAIYTQKIPKKKSSFRDRIRLHVSGGRGGAGCSSYDTDPYGKGGPDGANGGRGGDVYLVSTDQLANFQMETFHLKGQNGRAGGSSLAKGQNGFSLKVPIPAGTVVSEILSTDPQRGEYKLKFLADMDRPGLEMKVATGGDGGLGNRAFKTQYRKQARFSTIGRVGTARWLHLELKCIADVGLVGYPNAGKSSFLAAISNATPEIANYPFTTLHPQVGVVELGAFQEDGNDESSLPPSSSLDSNSAIPHATPLTLSSMSRMTVADLPGLISGASRANKGLGHEFLKHIQRTKVLCYVLDISGNDDRCPIEDFRSLQQELQHFDSTLLRRQSIIIANKIDNTSKRKKSWMKSKLNELSQVTTLPIYVTSCLNRTGLSVVVQELGKMVEQQLTDDREEGKRMIIEEKRRVDQIERETEEETKMLEAKEWEEKKIEQRQLEGVDEEADNQDDDEDEFVESFQTAKKSPSTSSKRSKSMKKLKSN